MFPSRPEANINNRIPKTEEEKKAHKRKIEEQNEARKKKVKDEKKEKAKQKAKPRGA